MSKNLIKNGKNMGKTDENLTENAEALAEIDKTRSKII